MTRGKANKKGRSTKSPPFTPIFDKMMDCPAFMSLSHLAQCLYWRLRRLARFDGSRNGQVFLSTRDAAEQLHAHQDTVRKAFYELQAKGFIMATQLGSIGFSGEGKATLWRLTELPTPTDPKPTKEYLSWRPGHDFPVQKGKAPPNKKQNPALMHRAGRPNSSGASATSDAAAGVACPKPSGVSGNIKPAPALDGRAYKDLPAGRGQR